MGFEVSKYQNWEQIPLIIYDSNRFYIMQAGNENQGKAGVFISRLKKSTVFHSHHVWAPEGDMFWDGKVQLSDVCPEFHLISPLNTFKAHTSG